MHNDSNKSLHEYEDEEEQQSQRFSGSPSLQSQPAASSSSSSVLQPKAKAKAALALTALLAMTALLATANMGVGKGFSAISTALLSPVDRSLTRKGAESYGYDHASQESLNPEQIEEEVEFMSRKGEGKSSRHMNGISGSNINAYTVPTGGEAVFNDVVFDASNTFSTFSVDSMERYSVGLSLQKFSKATICSAKLIKGGLAESLDYGYTLGAVAIHVDEGSSLDIVEGYIEGGDDYGGSSLKIEKDATVRIGSGRNVNIRGGENAGARNTAVIVIGAHLDVFGGEIGDKKSGGGTQHLLDVKESMILTPGAIAVPGIVNIYGGKFHSGQRLGSQYDIKIDSPTQLSKVNIYGKDLEKVLLNGDDDMCKVHRRECKYRIRGKLSDGHKIDVIGMVEQAHNDAQLDSSYTIINGVPFNPPDFSGVC